MTRKFLILSLEVTKKCNLDCRYCYIAKGEQDMAWSVAKQSVDFAIKLMGSGEKVSLGFTAAESLMNWKLVKKIIMYAQSKGVNRFCLATNGVLLTPTKLLFFKKNNVSLQISIDGDVSVFNANRVFENEKGAFLFLDKKLNLVKKYLNKNYIEIRITFTPDTVKHLEDSIRYIIEKNLSSNFRINMRPVVMNAVWQKENFKELAKVLAKIKNLLMVNGSQKMAYKIAYAECMPMDNLFSELSPNGYNATGFCSAGVEKLSVDIEGNIYPCHVLAPSKYAKKEKFILGNVRAGVIATDRAYEFNQHQPNPCLSCFTWNYLAGGDSKVPLAVYRKIYKILLNLSNSALN